MNRDEWKLIRSGCSVAVQVIFLILLISWRVDGQCTLDTNVVLQEVDTINLIFEVEGAINDDLSDPTQGLCKVRLNFEHEFLGDIRIFLTSPGGQSIQLVGNEGNFGLTQFTEWDVCFIPEAQVPVPDPGFSPVWSNNQVWGSFGSLYTGSYHPFQGRLEDFTTGSVNGPWTLTAMDRTIFYEGSIRGIELIFCDDNGISCNPCEPGEPDLTIDRRVFCDNEDINVNAVVDWISNQPDSDLYSQRVFLLDDGDIVLDTGTNLNFSNPAEGTYRVCATSFYTGDTSQIPDIGQSWSLLEQRVNDGNVCAGLSTCIEVQVVPKDTTRVKRIECGTDSIEINGQVFDSSGIYYINTQNRFGCDSVIELDLDLVNIMFDVFVMDSLDCDTDSVLMTLSGIETDSTYNIEWRHEQGFLLDTITFDSALTFVSGEILTIVSSKGCSDTLRTQVVRDSTVPEVLIFGDTLNCRQDSALLTSITTATTPVYNWRKDGNLIGSSSDSIVVYEGGAYSLIVTDANGCSARATYEVIADTLPSIIQFLKDTLVCPEDSMRVALVGQDSLIDPLWSGPNGFRANGHSIITFREGWYTVQGTGSNGCLTVDSVLMTKGLSSDSIILAQIPIECLSDGRLSFWDFGLPLEEFTWITPDGGILRDSFVITSTPGDYIFNSISSNGCNRSDTISLVDNRVFPDIILDIDSIECLDDIGYARIIRSPDVDAINWISPLGDTTRMDSVLLSGNGWYHVEVTGVNGCISKDSFEVNAGRSPTIEVFGDTITCRNRGSSEVWAVSNQNGLSYTWTSQGRVLGMDSTLIVNEGGWYKCMVMNAFGCTVTDSVLVLVDTTAPMVIAISPDTLNCRRSEVEIRTFVMPNLVQYSWSGPSGFMSTDKNPLVRLPGIYQVRVTSVNGCSDSTSVTVLLDTLAPNPSIMVDTINCDRPMTDFISDTIGVDWSWTWVSPLGDTITGLPYSSSIAGDHKLIVRDEANGCDNEIIVNLAEDIDPPQLVVRDTFIGCGDSSIVIRPQTIGAYREVRWFGPGGFRSDSLENVLYDSGEYFVELVGENGCVGLDSFTLELRNRRVQAQIVVDNMNCRQDSGILSADVFGPVQNEFWLTTQSERVNSRVLVTDVPGQYTFVVESADGCLDSFFVDLTRDTQSVPIMLEKNGDFVCQREVVQLFVDTILDPTLHELILLNEARDTLQWSDWRLGYPIREPGTYYIEVTREINGCISYDSVVVDQVEDPLLTMDISTSEIWCPEISDGVIDIVNISGGTPPYRAELNGLDYGGVRSFDRLRSGVYSLVVSDTFGCQLDTVLDLSAADLPMVSAGMDTIVTIGTEINLQGSAVIPPSTNYTIDWKVSSDIIAENDLNPLVRIDSTTLFHVELTLENGCKDRDDVLVSVDPTPRVFVPNTFTPNDDDVNDVLKFFFGAEVESVEFVEVYDRWGEMVYAIRDVEPNSPDLQWDGTLDGQPLVPGVMVYRVLVRDRSGERFLFEGSVTLLK